jgi:putative Ca2+/H+ antiporter (TMEM165/GDT1 family)
VVLGALLGSAIPDNWIKLAAGVAFIVFGLWTLRGDELSDDECKNIKGKSPFLLVATTFFLAELGDKTMLTTVTLATDYSMIPVWIGSTLGMVASDGLAIIAGLILGAKLPEKAIKIGAAFIFFSFGIWKAIEGGIKLPPYAWAVGGVVVIALVVMFIINIKKETRSAVVEFTDEHMESVDTKSR